MAKYLVHPLGSQVVSDLNHRAPAIHDGGKIATISEPAPFPGWKIISLANRVRVDTNNVIALSRVISRIVLKLTCAFWKLHHLLYMLNNSFVLHT